MGLFTEGLEAAIDIEATPEEVWGALTAFASFGTWNPFLTSIEGEPVAGARLKVRFEPPGGRGATIRPRVTRAEPTRVLGWLGRFGIPGLFDGAHRFTLDAQPGGRTRFVQSEHFSGLFVPLLRRSLRTHTLAGFQAMNQALANRVRTAA